MRCDDRRTVHIYEASHRAAHDGRSPDTDCLLPALPNAPCPCAQFRNRSHPAEWVPPSLRVLRLEQDKLCHGRSRMDGGSASSSFLMSADLRRGITSIRPLALTTTSSCTSLTTIGSPEDQMMQSCDSWATAGPTITFPAGSVSYTHLTLPTSDLV